MKLDQITLNDLLDLARNVAGFDDVWFNNATESSLRLALMEYRQQARKVLDVLEPAASIGLTYYQTGGES